MKYLAPKLLPIENAHPNFPLEWWFINGSIKSKAFGERDFMISFFSHNQSEEKIGTNNGYSLIFSVLESKTGKVFYRSQIDKVFLNDMISILEEKGKSDLDTDLVDVLLKELLQHGPPNPITTQSANVTFTNSNAEINWNEFLFTQNKKKFTLSFPLDNKKEKCSLVITPETKRYQLLSNETEKFLKGKMAYNCYPRMKISGKFKRAKVTGSAWMDHQWGDSSWHISEANRKVLGWDWFGINLENGTDIIVMIHKYAENNKKISSHAIVMNHKTKEKVSDKVLLTPLEYWESPSTHIKYPVLWEIDVPEFKINLKFTPKIKNQEIQIIGLARALWEGAGTVSGKINGKEVKGKARGEFFGYGYVFDFQLYLQNLANRVDKRIEEYFPKKMNTETLEKFVGKPIWKHEPQAYTDLLSVPIWDLILRQGKRWRPIFGILMLEALGTPSKNYEKSFCLAELVHSGALIIDDIQDNSLLRRGEKTLHLKYGTDVAINVGNTLYFLPYTELLNHKYLSDKKKLKIHQIWMKTYLDAHFGQTLDIYWSKNINIKKLSAWLSDSLEEKILQMYDYKTAAGARGLSEVAAVIAGKNKKTTKITISFARAFAVAFQIIDDVHNFSSSARWTKMRGEDLYNGKITFVIIRAINNLKTKDSNRLKKILSSKRIRTSKNGLNEGIELVVKSGALKDSIKIAREMSMKEWENFAKKIPSNEAKIMLNMLTLKMLDLAYDT